MQFSKIVDFDLNARTTKVENMELSEPLQSEGPTPNQVLHCRISEECLIQLVELVSFCWTF